MSATVQATCPGCQNVLRIPAEWADKALKCKKCGTVVQARRKSAAAAPAAPAAPPPAYPQPVPQPVIYAPPAAEAESDPFATDPESPVTKRYRRRRGGAWLNYLVLFGLLGGLAGAGYVYRDQIMALAQRPDLLGQNPEQVAPAPKVAPAPAKPAAEMFPRRLLFVHLSKYVYFNSLAAGKDIGGTDIPSKTATRMAFELRVPTDKENNQVFTLIDTGKDARPGLKVTLKHAIEQFLATCREQDRAVLYFGGHAVEADGKAYLVPAEGEPDDPNTLLPVDEVYAQLKACKAQQKLLMLDVCRFNPGFGAAKPGSEPMGEKLAELLAAAPPGVQVLTSCGPKENAQETTETGSEFLRAFREVTGGKGAKSADPAAPVPADGLAKAVGAILGQPREDTPAQTVRLTGTEGAQVAVNKEEPPAKRFDWPALPKGASADEVARLLKLADMPGIRKEFEVPDGLADIYPFAADRLKQYGPDGVSDADAMDAAKHPVRAATIEALAALRAKQGTDDAGGLRESFEGAADEKTKKLIANEQEPIAKRTLDVKEALDRLESVEKQLDEEKSKRWRALYQYTLAQARMRWAYLEEYNLSLGDIRTDRLGAAPAGGNPVWRLVSVPKMKSKKDIKEKADAGKELMAQIADEHKGTPWEVLAKMHKHVALGLAWKLVEAKKEDDKPAAEEKK